MCSSDLVTLDEEGYVTVIGRSKDLINRGGEKIFPTELEDFLSQHPEIIQAQVYKSFSFKCIIKIFIYLQNLKSSKI